MAKRKGLSKKIRFEVFKRDAFRCQYCGRGAPDVILNADHIQPVSDGGDNNILNLITSCFDCNSGKGARLLSEDIAVTKQAEQLRALAERREQIEMMAQWRQELINQGEIELKSIEKIINSHLSPAGRVVSDNFLRTDIRAAIKKYGANEVSESIDRSAMQYLKDVESPADREKFLNMIVRICYWRDREAKNPEEAQLRKIAYTAKKLWWTCHPQELQHELFKYRRDGIEIEDISRAIVASRGITMFREKMAEYYE